MTVVGQGGENERGGYVGAKVRGWLIDREVGRGGMATVYLARNVGGQARAAIKVLHSPLLANSEVAGRFVNEARALALVRHPNVAQVYELAVMPDGSPCIIMEYLAGSTLEQRAARGRMTCEEAVPIL
ncbi:MAG: protein kinase, partial [Deltaproteobacteria bacterium]|nr:protein kinase [Deltaproteobacteria bacterium]